MASYSAHGESEQESFPLQNTNFELDVGNVSRLQSHVWISYIKKVTSTIRANKDYSAEFFGTMVFVWFGTASVAAVTFYPWMSLISGIVIPTGFALGLGMGLIITYSASEGHLNPAVSVAFACVHEFPWSKALGYSIAQLCGAFCGAGLTYLLFISKFNRYANGEKITVGPGATAFIFVTFPDTDSSIGVSFFTEIILTGSFLFGISAILNMFSVLQKGCAMLAISMFIGLIVMIFGNTVGTALNPARDLGPRLLTLALGYGTETFTAFNYYFWVPIFGPIFGGIIGTFLYKLFFISEDI